MNLEGLAVRDRDLLLASKGAAFWCEKSAAKRLVSRGICHQLGTRNYTGELLIKANDAAMDAIYSEPLASVCFPWTWWIIGAIRNCWGQRKC